MFHLDYYKHVDPDTLYHPGSTTVIFSPSGEWYEDKHPQTHKDMLSDDHDMLVDIYGGDPDQELSHLPPGQRPAFRGRVEATKVAILGRFSLFQNNIPINPQEGEGGIFACWNSENHPLFKAFLRTYVQRLSGMGPIEVIKNKIVITTGFQTKAKVDEKGEVKWDGSSTSRLLAEYLGDSEEEIKKNIDPNSTPEALKKTGPKFKNQYRIGGRIYASAELFDMLKRVHTRPWEWDAVKAVWCHPDIDNYPELRAVRPSKCSKSSSSDWTPESKRRPRLSDYVRYAQKLGSPLPAGIGGTSESTAFTTSTNGFEEFFYEMDFCDHPDLFNPHPKWVQINNERRGA